MVEFVAREPALDGNGSIVVAGRIGSGGERGGGLRQPDLGLGDDPALPVEPVDLPQSQSRQNDEAARPDGERPQPLTDRKGGQCPPPVAKKLTLPT